jgi:hypothetical protein
LPVKPASEAGSRARWSLCGALTSTPLPSTEGVASKALSDAARRTDGALVGHRDPCPAPLRSRGGGREKAAVAELDQRARGRNVGSVRDARRRCRLRMRNACKHGAPRSVINRPPAWWAGHPLAWIPGYARLPAGIRGRFACGIPAGCAKSRRSRGVKRCRFAGIFTGATGLEPATSGVTGRSWRFRAERG